MGMHVAESHFQIVPTNPNPNGRCLFAPLGQHDGCEGPYIQFNAVAAAIGEGSAGPERLAAVACVRCLREAIADADAMIARGAIQPGPNSGEISMEEKMNAQPRPTMDFEDLPREERNRLLATYEPGETIRFPQGVVVVPGTKPTRKVVQSEPLSAPSPYQIVGISGEALRDDGEVPAKRRGEYDRVVSDEDEDLLAEIAEG